MDWIESPGSESISGYGYEPTSGSLVIQFIAGGFYGYFDVPEEVFEGLRTATSKGRYFQEFIRDKFAYQKLPYDPG